ncbi:MAG TPA: pyruvate:ferredoxin (flavodoxin) oxidoreductase [Chthoniobacteraceae bacterium]|jgi:pyruvate-ferredoxin/flavodoxin oxidoreductase|nr:pyruvate:ferredoxin (flavodoxin) oxidoreductase [Chthoniobacteraceae bacterium]
MSSGTIDTPTKENLALAATVDANEAVASVAYRLSETIAIYPITPSSPMAESCDEWSAKGKPNLWGSKPDIIEMQSEGGVAGALHGMLQTGALATTFTASQGLLLMIPNLYKIAGELLPFCFHVTARTLATHALSIFGDQSDVMACRGAGLAMLASNSAQEAADLACIGHAATLVARVPFMHFFDGFRTSHEVSKIRQIDDSVLQAMISEKAIREYRARSLTPDHPAIRGTAQNPDVFFQAREACNPFYEAVPGVVQAHMDRFAQLTGRQYELFDYAGHPEATRIIIAMGSGAETCEETAAWLNANGEKTGVIKVRLYRPFSITDFIRALPQTARSIAVLDRTKEPGALGEPLYLDVVAALAEARAAGLSRLECEPVVIGGRYGLGSKEFDPAMAKAVFEELRRERPKHHFTVGITDDVSGASLSVDPHFDIEPDDVVRAVFYGLGADGTVGANKNSIKIIGEETDNFAQGYFVYDSKKSGAMTISHLRFGPRPIGSHYLIKRANFVACHQPQFLERYDVLEPAIPGGVFLLNTPHGPEKVWEHLPREAQAQIVGKRLRFYVIDADSVARAAGAGRRINTIMQTCFFAISGVLPREEAIAQIKKAIRKTYGRKGEQVVAQNFAAVDAALAGLYEVPVPDAPCDGHAMPPVVADAAPEMVKRLTATMLAGKGDLLPVSAFTPDGTWPIGTARWEKRNIADRLPVWESALCIQCNKCVFVCPHAAIRAKHYSAPALDGAPEGFLSTKFRGSANGDLYTLQVAPEDCTGCTLCVTVCPAKDKSNASRKAINMAFIPEREKERKQYDFFLALPNPDPATLKPEVKSIQFAEPLFEYSGACAGCGETPYLKLLTQMYGDRLLIANATGCSSIYGGNLPTTPYCANSEGRGPAWSNSLFEDNAEYGLGFRFAVDKQMGIARELLTRFAPQAGDSLVRALLDAPQKDTRGIFEQRERVSELRRRLATIDREDARRLEDVADFLVRKSVWIVGGDGWAYDIGYGGLDHVISTGLDVNILVLDTEVYSNTGGQMSKSTPFGATAKFAMAGKRRPKKDLGLMAMTYGNVYVARAAFGAKDSQTVKVFDEAGSYDGPSLVIAYSHCIAHGYAMQQGLEQQRLAVDSGTWPLFRFDPRRVAEGKAPLQLDSGPPKVPVKDYLRNELRFRMKPEAAPAFEEADQKQVDARVALYNKLATIGAPQAPGEPR